MKSEFDRMRKIIGDNAVYLGDAVYASYDGYQIWLHTTNGLSITNRIALEPPVWQALLLYRESIGADKE